MQNLHKPYGPYERYVKYPLDFMLALVALIVLSPLLLILTIVGAIAMKGNPFFVQKRTGRIDTKTGHEKIFSMIKFRTMSNAKDENGNLLPDEDRLNGYGRFLRSTSCDELPELLNIIAGNMSIIGPRALPVRYLPYYTEEEHKRHSVRPGLSGLAQVNGRNYVSWEDKFKMDLQYISHVTFWGDVMLIFKTVSVVFRHENIDTGSFIEKDGVIYRPLDVERREKVHEN